MLASKVTFASGPQVVRVKNLLSPLYDSAKSAGYRNVALNLRLATPEARRLGVASHVCEIQIILRAFADLKVSARIPAGSHS